MIVANPADHNFASELIVFIKKIDPNNGLATFDLKLLMDSPKDDKEHKIQVWILNGHYSIHGDSPSIWVDSELNRTPVTLKDAQQTQIGGHKRVVYSQEGLVVKATTTTPGYLFPFDAYRLSLIPALTDETDGKVFSAILEIEVADPRYIHSIPHPVLTTGQKTSPVPGSGIIQFARPYYAKISIVLPLVVAFACASIAFYRVTFTELQMIDSMSIFAFTFAMLVALPSLRGLIVPPDLIVAPCFDFPALAVWIISLYTLLISVYKHDLQKPPTPPQSGVSR